MMGHDQPWLGGSVEALGYVKAKDLVAYRMSTKGGLIDRLRKLAERTSGDTVIRSMDKRRYREEIALIASIFKCGHVFLAEQTVTHVTLGCFYFFRGHPAAIKGGVTE